MKLTSSPLTSGVLRGSLWRNRGRDDRRLRLLQCLQHEAPEGPTLLDVYSGLRPLCPLRGAFQYLSLTGAIALEPREEHHNYFVLLVVFLKNRKVL